MKDPEENNTDPWAEELFNHLCAINSPMPQVIVRVAIRNPASGYSVAIARAHPALARKNDLEAMSKT